MAACPDWPVLAGEGRVTLDAAAHALREAMVAHADCRARFEGLRLYVREVVRPE